MALYASGFGSIFSSAFIYALLVEHNRILHSVSRPLPSKVEDEVYAIRPKIVLAP